MKLGVVRSGRLDGRVPLSGRRYRRGGSSDTPATNVRWFFSVVKRVPFGLVGSPASAVAEERCFLSIAPVGQVGDSVGVEPAAAPVARTDDRLSAYRMAAEGMPGRGCSDHNTRDDEAVDPTSGRTGRTPIETAANRGGAEGVLS